MKKLIVFLLAFAFAVSFGFTAFAADGIDLKYNQSVTENGKIVVKISVADIKDSTGVAIVDYLIKFDSTVLKLEDSYVNLPDAWKPFTADEMAENLSQPVSEGFRWSVLNCVPGYGITENNQLFVELLFTRLQDVDTEIELVYKAVANDNVEEIYGPNKVISISSAANNTSDVLSESTGNESVSNDNAPESGAVESNSEELSSSEAAVGNSLDNQTETSVNDSDSKDGNIGIILLSIIGGVVVIAGIVYLVMFLDKKGKK